MEAAPPRPATRRPGKKATDIRVLHCLNPDCGGLLAYEVDSNDVLSLDLAWTAKREGGVMFFPCPKCQGKNIVEAVRDEKRGWRHKVTRWEPGQARHDREAKAAERAAEERLELMPRSVRDKLDRIGVKVHLKDWQALSMPERQRLRDLPCATAEQAAHYAAAVEQLILRLTGRAPERITVRAACRQPRC
ncbi:MAG: nitrate reductase associated protein [Candidatus Binatia bacterium]